MSAEENSVLPPLPELITQIQFDVYGLASPVQDLVLRSLHYGVDETSKHIVGLGLFYAQTYRASPKTFAVESSLLPSNLLQNDPASVTEWSLSNLLSLCESLEQFHSHDPPEFADEATMDQRFAEMMQEVSELRWTPLAPESTMPLLVGMEVTRTRQDLILARRFEGPSMLLVAGLGFDLNQFIQAVKLLIPLQDSPAVARRHQEEFEQITLQG